MVEGREITISDKAELVTFATVNEVPLMLVELLPLLMTVKLAGKLLTWKFLTLAAQFNVSNELRENENETLAFAVRHSGFPVFATFFFF